MASNPDLIPGQNANLSPDGIFGKNKINTDEVFRTHNDPRILRRSTVR